MIGRRKSVGFDEFKRHFGSEVDCANFLLETRFASDFRCCACGTLRRFKLYISDYRLKCAGCSKAHYLRSGTMMEGSCLPLTTWFEAMWLLTVTRTGISTDLVSTHLGIGTKAALRMRRKINEHMERLCNRDMLGLDRRLICVGDVEIKGIRNSDMRGTRRTTIIGAWDGSRLVADTLPARLPKHPLTFIKGCIAPGARIASSDDNIYSLLRSRQYFNLASKSDFAESPEFEKASLSLESHLKGLKRTILGTHRQSKFDHLRLYVKEYEYRFLHRGRPSDMFCDLISTQPEIEELRY